MRRLVALVALVGLVVGTGRADAAVSIVGAEATLPSGPVLFGEQFAAELEILVSTKLVDAEDVRASARFDPFDLVTGVERSELEEGPVTRVRFRYLLQCASLACTTGPKTERVIRVASAVVEYRRQGKKRTLRVPWLGATPLATPDTRTGRTTVPPGTIVLISRVRDQRFRPLTATAARQQVPLDPLLALPVSVKASPPSYRASPLALALVLFAAALVALAAGAVVARPLLVLLRRGEPAAPPLSPLEQAVVSVERAGQREPGSGEHREALALLARQLRRANLDELVNRARKLAWSEDAPTAAASRALTSDVRGHMGGQG